jgi:hypothetical protein
LDDNRRAPAAAAPPKRRRYRIAEWVEETKTSRPTTWRRIKDGTLKVAYYGKIPYIVDGPREFFE